MNGVASYTAPLRLADLPAMLSIIIPAEEKTNIYVLLLEKSRGSPHMKGARILVVSLKGVNFGFWSYLGCSGQNAIIFSRKPKPPAIILIFFSCVSRTLKKNHLPSCLKLNKSNHPQSRWSGGGGEGGGRGTSTVSHLWHHHIIPYHIYRIFVYCV